MTLYKYCSFERIDILENNWLRCSPSSVLNDIFESFPFFGTTVIGTDEDLWDERDTYYELKFAGLVDCSFEEFKIQNFEFKKEALKNLEADRELAA